MKKWLDGIIQEERSAGLGVEDGDEANSPSGGGGGGGGGGAVDGNSPAPAPAVAPAPASAVADVAAKTVLGAIGYVNAHTVARQWREVLVEVL